MKQQLHPFRPALISTADIDFHHFSGSIFYESRIFQGICYHTHAFDKLSSRQFHPIPRENTRYKFQLLFLHAFQQALQHAIVLQSLLPAAEQPVKRNRHVCLFSCIPRPAAAKRISDILLHPAQISGHKGSHHLRIRCKLQYGLPRRNPRKRFPFQSTVKIRHGQDLISRSMLQKLSHHPNGILQLIKGQRPQSYPNPDAVIAAYISLCCSGIVESLLHENKHFIRDAIRIFHIADSRPDSHRPFYRGEADQVILTYGGKNRLKSFHGSAVRIFTDRLPHSLLKPGRKQEIRKEPVKGRTGAFDNSPY